MGCAGGGGGGLGLSRIKGFGFRVEGCRDLGFRFKGSGLQGPRPLTRCGRNALQAQELFLQQAGFERICLLQPAQRLRAPKV